MYIPDLRKADKIKRVLLYLFIFILLPSLYFYANNSYPHALKVYTGEWREECYGDINERCGDVPVYILDSTGIDNPGWVSFFHKDGIIEVIIVVNLLLFVRIGWDMAAVEKWWVNAKKLEKVNIILGQMLIERREQDAHPDEAEIEKRNSYPSLTERLEYDGIAEREAIRDRKSSIPLDSIIPPSSMRESSGLDGARIPWELRRWLLESFHQLLFDDIYILEDYGDTQSKGWETLPKTWTISRRRAELLMSVKRFHKALECLHEAKTDIENKIRDFKQTLPSTPEEIYLISNYIPMELPDNWDDIKDEYKLENISYGETTYRERIERLLGMYGLELDLKMIEEEIDELEKIMGS
ncbi:hypothetical protein FIM05_01505 [SAR202 cluster bacterium AD-802-K11_MRT_200m]|nr:hypothetical protein [SAR202 cluster bacterium AD-802-K11_MRT_200m]